MCFFLLSPHSLFCRPYVICKSLWIYGIINSMGLQAIFVSFTYFLHILCLLFAHFFSGQARYWLFFHIVFSTFPEKRPISLLPSAFFSLFLHIPAEYAVQEMGGKIAGQSKPHHEKARKKVSNCGKNPVNHQDSHRNVQISHGHNKGVNHRIFQAHPEESQQRKHIKAR